MLPLRTLSGTLFLISCLAKAQAQADISVLESTPCDGNGNARSVRVGEPFWVLTRFKVTATLNTNYKYKVETPYAKVESPRLSFGTTAGEYYVYWGPIPSLMDGPISVVVTLDPEKRVREQNRMNNVARYTISPVTASRPIEYFAPANLGGRLGIDVLWNRRSAVPASVSTWIPLPQTETFQQVLSHGASPAFQSVSSDPFDQPILLKLSAPTDLAPIHEEITFSTVAHSARIDLAALKLLGSGVAPGESQWLQAERYVELARPEFARWVEGVVPASTSGALSTVEIAQALYRSVLQRCTYEFKRGTAPSAYQALKKKKGDCGALSSLFVALCRTAGIPARTVSGFMTGRDDWHIWAEFHVAGAGWVPADPAFAEGRLAKGADLPIYFGVIPELNERVATSFGFDRQIGGQFMPMLQSPAVLWTGRGVKLQRATTFSELN